MCVHFFPAYHVTRLLYVEAGIGFCVWLLHQKLKNNKCFV